MRYLEKLLAAQRANNSWLCIGLDPQPEQLPIEALKWDEPVLPFTRRIIEATADLVCAYKPNLGFYMQWGAAGVIALERTIAAVPAHIPVILDAKIGDIGHTQAAWGRGLFDEWGVDAITVNPYVGADAVRPLLARRPDKAVYVLARTSNPGAPQFQGDLTAGEGLSAAVLRQASRWVGQAGELIKLMVRVGCRAGRTQIHRILRHAINETEKRRVHALIFIGDSCEESVDTLGDLAGRLGLLGVKAFVFHEGNDREAAYAFQEIARLTGGAACRFDASAPAELRALLRAVAAYAAGGRKALVDLSKREGGPVALLERQIR